MILYNLIWSLNWEMKMSVSKIGKENTENGTLVKIDGLVATIKRHSNSEEVRVSISEFLQKNITPKLGKTYRYNIYLGVHNNVRLTNIQTLLRLSYKGASQVIHLEPVFSERYLQRNAVFEWFDWGKGYGAVRMSADGATAFVHVSLVDPAVTEFGGSLGVELKGQTVHVVVIPDPEKSLRVTRLELV
jgi:cold shock CspA family protein